MQDRTRTINQTHGVLLGFGVSLPVGKTGIVRLPELLSFHALPPRLVAILERLHTHHKYLKQQIGEIDREFARQLAEDDNAQALMNIPGIGPITTSVLASEMGDGKQLRCSRDFTASLGLVPRQYSTGGDPICSESVDAATRIFEACSFDAQEPTCDVWRSDPGAWQTGLARF